MLDIVMKLCIGGLLVAGDTYSKRMWRSRSDRWRRLLKAGVHPKFFFNIRLRLIFGSRIEAVLTVLEIGLLRRFRVWAAGLGVPIWLTGFRQASDDGRIHRVTSSRKKPNVGAALYGACAPTFGYFRLVTRCMRPSEGCQSNRNAQSRSPYPEAAENVSL